MVGLNEEGFFVDFVEGWLVSNAQETQQIKHRKDEKIDILVLIIVLFFVLGGDDLRPQIFRLKIDFILEFAKNESESPYLSM